MSRIEKKDFESQEILAEKFFICRRQKKIRTRTYLFLKTFIILSFFRWPQELE